MLRRLLGLEAKMRQYRDGAVFVRGVQEAVGVDGFNAVWTSPETLPAARRDRGPAALGPPRPRLTPTPGRECGNGRRGDRFRTHGENGAVVRW